MIRTGAYLLLATCLACSGNSNSENGSAGGTPEGSVATRLASSVEVDVSPSTVRMVLHVTNPTTQPVTLEFASAQKYDFAVLSSDGTEVWRWSRDMAFAAALTSQTVAPGATVDFAEAWQPGGRKGTFTAVAELKATNHRLQERTEFVIR